MKCNKNLYKLCKLFLKFTIYVVKNDRVICKTPFVFTFGGSQYNYLRKTCKISKEYVTIRVSLCNKLVVCGSTIKS